MVKTHIYLDDAVGFWLHWESYSGCLSTQWVVDGDFASGNLFDGGSILTATTIGATLLAMADIDPGDWALDSEPILGILT